jgi:hypothetical protein
MFFQNLSKRKVLLLIINALISILMISCVIFLYYYLPASQQRTFTVEKENSVHITKSHFGNINSNGMRSSGSGLVNANVRISSGRRPTTMDRSFSQEEAIDDTIYIDNDNYGDESYDNSGNFANEKPVTAPVTIIERPVERSQTAQDDDDDFYYENYEDTDDEDIVSSGNGKIVVNIRKPKPIMRATTSTTTTRQPPEQMQPVVENVYSVSSEIVSNLKNQYSVEDTKQINKADKLSSSSSSTDAEYDKEDGPDLDEWTTETDAKGKRLIGNNKSLVERSRQLLLCESARTGELCRMLFKGTVG